ncbi:hypothetical protein [Nonomuraea cavernae]|uniref:Uncharacterized protein n=1 Tax=Nonomuraea cavernae TaxID=2045107 RepID=A0A917ZDF0_9ACTN|nr:hypothetical protein [Nonomuraea cavernae]MCA2190633.1 hypothetical protein [Nonomuraea cavernae]GGO81290.1 hypothetical protein GCM10012289_69920 [Nonomuraea cavernae]
MSFGTFARRVRDPALPHQRRVAALRSCVQLYRPIGFEATLSFLHAKAGPFGTEEAALLRALAMLEASRSAWQEAKHAYAAARREAKQRGQRSPHPNDINPYTPLHWYGARREAALHAVSFWHQRRLSILLTNDDKPAHTLCECVQTCLDTGGHLPPGQRRLLADCIDQFAARLQPALYHDDPAEYFRTRDLLTVARHLEAMVV